jgi:CBS domain-containing protein
MVAAAELEQAVAQGRSEHQLAALLKSRASGQLHEPAEPPHLHPDHSLAVALERLGSSGLDLLPVVSRADVRELLGVVTLRDILSSFGVAGSAGESSPRDRT